jgi:hypothetical protein
MISAITGGERAPKIPAPTPVEHLDTDQPEAVIGELPLANKVVLAALLGPSSATTSPADTYRNSSLTAARVGAVLIQLR